MRSARSLLMDEIIARHRALHEMKRYFVLPRLVFKGTISFRLRDQESAAVVASYAEVVPPARNSSGSSSPNIFSSKATKPVQPV